MIPRLIHSSARAAAACLFVVIGACGKSNPTPGTDSTSTPKPSSFSVTPAQRQRIHIVTVQLVSFRPVIEATGNVAFNGDKSTQVLSPVSGPAIRVVAQIGSNVTRGEPLAYVSSPDFAAAVAGYRKAQTAYRHTRQIAERDSALFKNDALARADLEGAQSDVAAAQADLESSVQAMHALGVTDAQIQSVRDGHSASIEAIIRSPINGTVVEKLISNGQLLAAGTTACFTIADLSSMWVNTNVFANDIKDVSVGETVNVLTDVTQLPLPGRVSYIGSLADPGTKAVSVRVEVPNNNHALRRDMFVRVQIKSGQQHQGILVPVSAVLRDDQNLPFVFMVSGPGFLRRRIDIGKRVGDQYDVTSGLKAGDQVVNDGALFLQFAETQ